VPSNSKIGKMMPRSLVSLVSVMVMIGLAPVQSVAWEHYGNDAGGSKFSDLEQIDSTNVDALTQAWVYQTGETGEGYREGRNLTFQATPLFWNDMLFLNSSFGKAYAVDAVTGEEVWRFDAGFSPDDRYDESAARGVTLWHSRKPMDVCEHRVIFGDLRGQLHVLDAQDGKPCGDFGDQGHLDLTQGVGQVEPGSYTLTSPPALLGNSLFMGSAIGDNRRVDSERGIVRAIDVISGEILWSWDPIPRGADEPAFTTWLGDSAKISGGGNAWAPLSVDAEMNLVFVPTSAASPDFFGGHRAGSNLYTNSVVALDAASGEVVWHRQLVHHDVWDYDTPAQPVLVDIDLGEGVVSALVQVTKTGMMFVLDRRTGEPLIPIEERAVPQDGVPGEVLWPTQPFSTLPPLVSHAPITKDDAFGVMFFDKRSCEKRIERHRSEGIFTPPSLEGSLFSPGYAGGINWGGVAVDAKRGIAVSFVNTLPTVVRLVPREDFDPENPPEDMGWSRMSGTPYVMQRDPFISFLGLPCVRPPWGKMVAMDLVNRKIAWETPIGSSRDLAPGPVPDFDWGMPGMGGPLITAGGLVFVGAVAEHKLRALDIVTGEIIWEAELPRAGMASPMTYEVDGRQYVVIAAGGHAQVTPETGDYLVAFALEK
jgi:quinoprotein glucose dehydrogenase